MPKAKRQEIDRVKAAERERVFIKEITSHSSHSEGDHCPLRLSGLPAAHTFFRVIPQSLHLIPLFTK